MKSQTNPLNPLLALSPLDGRYAKKAAVLSDYFSEAALFKYRVHVEMEWFISLLESKALNLGCAFTAEDKAYCKSLFSHFQLDDAEKIKEIEKTTQHDVKAVEYFIKEKFAGNTNLSAAKEWVHFACTSEDINNTAYALMFQNFRNAVLVPKLKALIEIIKKLAIENKTKSLLALTHGQSASPTTLGKELANIVARLEHALLAIEAVAFRAKLNGAVGNYNAHHVAFPQYDWQSHSAQVLRGMGLQQNAFTTQIDPHDDLATFCDAVARFHTILLDASRDLWGYISRGIFKLKKVAGEVGSSTMPHKVNPIHFENAEGNLGLANALLHHFSSKLPVSRYQRDLSDSVVLRSVGSALGYGYLAYEAFIEGLNRLSVNDEKLLEELNDHYEVLAEAVQTVMRRLGLDTPYEQLKALTQGEKLTQSRYEAFLNDLSLPENEKKRLKAMRPQDYIGLAAELVEKL